MAEITQKDVDAYIESNKIFAQKGKILRKRIDEILQLIHKTFYPKSKRKVHWWYSNAQEGECGTLDVYQLNSDDISGFELGDNPTHSIGMEGLCYGEAGVDQIDYSYSFPKRFLFMKDQEIQSEIRLDMHDVDNEFVAIKKTKKTEQTIKRAAIKKLTKEERKLLGIKE